MGKAQSKGSAEITTEPSKEIQEGSGKLKKLDDAYFKENESSDKENKVTNDCDENEKNESLKVEDSKPTADEETDVETQENKLEAPLLEENSAEEIKEANSDTESAVKPKKEKVKRKWSLRNLSFGKKDKQKPSKKDKKNEENKAVAENSEEKLADDGELQPIVEKKSQDVEIKTKPLEPVVEAAVVELQEIVKPVEIFTPTLEEAVRSNIPEPIVEIVTEEKAEAPIETEKLDETPVRVVECESTTPIEKDHVEIKESVTQPPAIPATPPPSQFSVFAESMNTQTLEDTISETVSTTATETITETLVDIKNCETQEIDLKPVAEMVEAVLEQAVEHVESEMTEKSDEELPLPPSINEIEASEETVLNGNGEHIEDSDETGKLENGLHNYKEDINESEPFIEELKKEDKVSDKIAQELPLAPEIITE